MLEVEKKIGLVKSWIANLGSSNYNLNIKYLIDKEDCLEVEISNSKLIWSVLVNNPDFAPYKNIFIEIINLDDVDDDYILGWGDEATTSETDIINKLNDTIKMLKN